MRLAHSAGLGRLRAAPWAPWLLAGGAYLILALLALAPALPSFARAVPGSAVAQYDGWQNVWNMWWFQRALAAGQNPFYTQIIYYPQGADMTGQTLTSTNGLLMLPVTTLFGPVAGYNAAVLLSFVLAGLGGYALAFQLTRQHLAAFVAGCALAFSPFHMTKVWDGQLELIAIQWLPLYLLFLLRSTEDGGGWGDALAAGLFLALVGYTSWYYMYFAALASLLMVLLWLPYRAGARALLLALARLALAAALALLLIFPALLSLLRSALENSGPSASAALLPARSATLLDFWLPSYLHPLWGAWVSGLGAGWHPGIAAWNVSLGYTPLALALVALARSPGAAWRWLVLAGAACLLALGPTLNIGPWQTGIAMPYAALATLPGGNISHRPGHFVVIACVALAPLVGLGVQALLAGAPRPARERAGAEPQRPPARPASPWRSWLIAGLLLAMAVEFLPPRWNLWAPVPHPYYDELAKQPGALLILPAAAEDMRPLIDQMRHGRPILGGLLARAPSYDPPRAPGVRELWQPRDPALQLLPTTRALALSALSYYGAGHIVIERSRMHPSDEEELDRVLAWLLPDMPPAYADDQLRVYRVPPAPPRSFAFFRSGWYPEEHADERSWRWMRASGEIVLANPTAERQPVSVFLGLESHLRTRELALEWDGVPMGSWDIPAQPGELHRVLHLMLPPGDHVLSLQAPADPQPGPDSRQLTIVLTDIALVTPGSTADGP